MGYDEQMYFTETAPCKLRVPQAGPDSNGSLCNWVVSGCAGKSKEPLHGTDSAFEGYLSDMFPLGAFAPGSLPAHELLPVQCSRELPCRR